MRRARAGACIVGSEGGRESGEEVGDGDLGSGGGEGGDDGGGMEGGEGLVAVAEGGVGIGDGISVNFEGAIAQVEDPIIEDGGAGVEGGLGVSIKSEGGIGNFDHEEGGVGMGFAEVIAGIAGGH